ncbi:chromosome partitioning protein ParA [Comamonas sp. Tr-654]|uniref:chromosome partitioning protein ParA n=1 Tax=Comamonas sp. Tr-654 TaxID=2608341 RepID=UPI00141DE3EE|nr:chromosome partitioning protein ParA [Comamonas sp. Tr-654]NIF82448.1 chromosome partitioning protein ParA [Comamonas sp. Tr-654]
MNKIIVVGHPQSGFDGVEELLLDSGMAEANPSRREGFMPAQISETLVKVHGSVPVQQVCVADQLAQIEVAPVWQGLALDLMLANMEQPLWGWADAQAVYLLDYWKSQDPQTVFVLVFDEPQSVFTRQALEHADASPQEQEARINGWIAYNSALLHFHLRHPERSLLVHAQQVQTSAQSYLQQLSLHVDAQLCLPSEAVQSEVEGQNQELSNDKIQIRTGAVGKPKQALDGNALAQWLAQQLLEDYPQAIELYEQLQAAASMPQRSQGQAGRQMLASTAQANRRYQAWSAFVAQQSAMQAQAKHLLQLDKELDGQALQVQQRERQIEQLNQAGARAEQYAQEQERKLVAKRTELQSSEQENQLLLKQLHKVQEELESRYHQAVQQEKALTELNKVKADLKAAREKALAELKVAQDKAVQLQQSEARLKTQLQGQFARGSTVDDLKKENELLLNQLHKVQEELERHFLENSKLKAAQKPQPAAIYGAADRVKQQLSYRLGAAMIRQSRSLGGWLNMPFALSAETKRFRQDQAARKDLKLPPIAQYRDAYEAEVIKRHLSYRLGARFLTNTKTLGGRISLPWSLYAEVKAFRKDRQSH